jgi:hypothetical protein
MRVPTVSETIPHLVKTELVWMILSEGALLRWPVEPSLSFKYTRNNSVYRCFPVRRYPLPCRTTTNLAVQHAPNVLRPTALIALFTTLALLYTAIVSETLLDYARWMRYQ